MSLTKFTDVTLYWANLTERNSMSGKYQVDLGNLSDAQVEKLEDLGVNVRNKGNEADNFVTAKSANYEIKPYDKNGNELKGILIGNGSKATVLFDTYSWKTPAGKKGVSVSIKKLVITDLQEYNANEAIEDEVEEVL
jgi:hypothetical protein